MERPNRKHLTQRLKLVLNFDPFFKHKCRSIIELKCTSEGKCQREFKQFGRLTQVMRSRERNNEMKALYLYRSALMAT